MHIHCILRHQISIMNIHVQVVSLLPTIQRPTEYLINARHRYFLDILSKTKLGIIAYDFLSL